MKSKLRQHWGVLLISTVALGFIALQIFFSAQRKQGITELYFADRMTEAHRLLIEEYNRLHEGKVKIVPLDFPNTDFTTNERKEILARLLRGEGEGIDLFAVDVIWVQRFERWSEPLAPYWTKEELAEFSGGCLRSCYKDGTLVAIPFGQVRGVLVYRADLLRTLPGGEGFMDEVNRGTTWDRFVTFGASVRSSHPYYIFPAAEYEGLLCSFTENLLGLEKEYFSRHGFNFVTPSSKRALQLLVDLVQKHRVSPEAVTTMTEVPSYEYFIRHDGLFLRGWSTYGKDFPFEKGSNPDLKMAPIPHFPDGDPASTIGGWNLMVSKFSAKKKEAIAFAKFLLRKESQKILFTQGGFFPVIRTFYEDDAYRREFPELIEAGGILASGVHRPPHKNYTKYSEILAHYLSLAIGGRIGVDEALARATKAIETGNISLSGGGTRPLLP